MSWDKGIELFKLSPVIGIGFNNIRNVSIENGLIRPFTPDGGNSGNGVDSSWLLILVTTGIAGFSMFAYFYLNLFWGFVKSFKKDLSGKKAFLMMAGLTVGLFVQSQFINSLFYPQIMLTYFLLTGIYYADTQQNS